MKIAGFEFAEGTRFQAGKHPDANVVGAHIEMLREKFKGELTPGDVVDDARNDNSPLHSFFEWDDTEAARQHRLKQARGLIRSVVAIYTSPDKPAQRMRAYVHIPQVGAPHYREVTHAMSIKNTRDIVLNQALRELNEFKRKYAHLKEFAKVVDVIDRLQIEGQANKAA